MMTAPSTSTRLIHPLSTDLSSHRNRAFIMNVVPDSMICDPLLDMWIGKQIELLSTQALTVGAEVKPVTQLSHRTYSIEFNGEVVCCSPERAYATLHFLQALQERIQQDFASSQTCPQIFFDSIQIKRTFDLTAKKYQ
ncbi:MAG: hypothetical protein F6J95_031480 [Leptolyngbya sp. SIO1E4]|nr:hypothetical protein [Leptolyngbya sp. SIO1E4]